jgi:hypothetical protein
MDKGAKWSKPAYIAPVLIFIAFTLWWLYLRGFELDASRNGRQIWGATYQVLAWYGAIVGLLIARKWGGHKSKLGRITLAFSVGLFLQVFGQCYSSYYVHFYHVESPPYPAIGDIGFFGSVLAYIYAVLLLAKVSGVGVTLKRVYNKLFAFLIPCIVLASSYFFFLKGYEFEGVNPVQIFLDFGYPFGQAFYVSIAILSLVMSRNVLGGMMRKPILFLIFALLFQYFSDVMFLYQAIHQTWYVGNINDYLYAASYFIMLISLIKLGGTFEKIKNS